jgi:SnoaL-like domain
MNGQQAVTLDGDRATGTSYCLVVLIGTQDGKPVRQTMGVTYDDEYVRRGGAPADREAHLALHVDGPGGGVRFISVTVTSPLTAREAS